MNYFWNKKPDKYIQPFFREKYSMQQRHSRRLKLQEKFPKGKFVYIVIEGINQFDQNAKPYIMIGVQARMTLLYLVEYLRKMLKINKSQSLFLQLGNKITDMGQTIGELYKSNAQLDGFLYIHLRTQATF